MKMSQLMNFITAHVFYLSEPLVLFPSESEGTLILPQVESFHRLQDNDATTIASDDSFFSAAEVSSLGSRTP